MPIFDFYVPSAATATQNNALQQPLVLPPPTPRENQPPLTIQQAQEEQPELYRNLLGLPVYSTFDVAEGAYVVSETGATERFDGFRVPEAVITATLTKNIVSTTTAGGYTIYEYIGENDIALTIQHLIFNTANMNLYPEREVAAVMKTLRAKCPLSVRGRLMEILGIHNIIVKDVKINPTTDYKNIQVVEFNAVSTVAPEIQRRSR